MRGEQCEKEEDLDGGGDASAASHDGAKGGPGGEAETQRGGQGDGSQHSP